MRWALLADIHANGEALRAVLGHLEDWRGARLVVAGDIIGYGPDPEACITLLVQRGAVCVAGNHEGMVLGRINLSRCNYAGIVAARWTRRVLSTSARGWLESLPTRRRAGTRLMVCHGDLDDPERYVDEADKARAVLASAARRGYDAVRVVCGHTHRAMCCGEGEAWESPPCEVPIMLRREHRYLINPGSVGQARFEAPLARYARYDDETDLLTFYALPYDSRPVCERLRRAGLVPRVTYPAPTRLGRHVERVQTRWARWRFG